MGEQLQAWSCLGPTHRPTPEGWRAVGGEPGAPWSQPPGPRGLIAALALTPRDVFLPHRQGPQHAEAGVPFSWPTPRALEAPSLETCHPSGYPGSGVPRVTRVCPPAPPPTPGQQGVSSGRRARDPSLCSLRGACVGRPEGHQEAHSAVGRQRAQTELLGTV